MRGKGEKGNFIYSAGTHIQYYKTPLAMSFVHMNSIRGFALFRVNIIFFKKNSIYGYKRELSSIICQITMFYWIFFATGRKTTL